MLGGLVWTLYRREALDWIFWAAWLPSFLYIGSWTRESLHYLLQFYPLLALGAARLLEAGVLRVAAGRGKVLYGVAVLCALPSLYQAVAHDRKLGEPDVRQQAAAWIETNLPDGTRLAMTWPPYCPRLALLQARQSIANAYADNQRALALLEEAWAGASSTWPTNAARWGRCRIDSTLLSPLPRTK